ncbi:MAG: hypothetical protein ACLQBA_07640 [Candidatus Binataceae bacterium]
MADKVIERRGFYAKLSSNRTGIVFKIKDGPWRALLVDFELGTAQWAPPNEVRSIKTGTAWIGGLTGKRPRSFVKDIETLE